MRSEGSCGLNRRRHTPGCPVKFPSEEGRDALSGQSGGLSVAKAGRESASGGKGGVVDLWGTHTRASHLDKIPIPPVAGDMDIENTAVKTAKKRNNLFIEIVLHAFWI